MSESTPRAVRPISRSSLRVVLFGMPDAGKSSLLGSLGQAAQTQEHLLDGHLTDLSGGLQDLRYRLYDDRPRETIEEVVPYPVTYESFTAGEGKRDFVLFDCDGRVANELLTRRRSLDGGSVGLAGEVLATDSLLLVIDASAPPAQVDADFAEFSRFLRFLEESRGRRTAVGGLPVFLVLSKCDLLARAEDTPTGWIERIEERKRQVHQRFKDFLAAEAGKPVPFGSIDLRVWATAVRRPELAGNPAKPREPYGVAELFRQCFAAAAGFQRREDSSGRRLWLTAGGAAGVVAAMIALATTFIANRETARPTGLEMRVAELKSAEGRSVSRRLSGRLQERISELREIKKDPEFARLSTEDQEYITQRLQELETYRDYLDKVRAALQMAPPPLRPDDPPFDETDLDRWQTQLDELTPPTAYQETWAETEASHLRADRLADLTALRALVARLEGDYRDLIRRGERLRNFVDWKPGDERDPKKWADWHAEVQHFLSGADRIATDTGDRIRPAGPSLTEVALRFRRVQRPREDWDRLKQQLINLGDLTAALGLPEPAPESRPPLLRWPGADKPPPSLDEVRERFKDLQRVYPKNADWPQLALPETVAPVIRARADTGYRSVVSRNGAAVPRREDKNALGQKLILDQLREVATDEKETFAHWEEVRQWLAGNPARLAGWREVAKLLTQLRDPKAEDPVAALTAFLGESRFEVDLSNGLTLIVPNELDEPPIGPLTVFHSTGGTDSQRTFRQNGAEQPEGDSKRYNLVPKGKVDVLIYRPGDSLWAEVPVEKKDGKERKLVWNTCRSTVYQFERLAKLPTLSTRPNEEQEGIKLLVRPGEKGAGLPVVPDLLPVVRLKK